MWRGGYLCLRLTPFVIAQKGNGGVYGFDLHALLSMASLPACRGLSIGRGYGDDKFYIWEQALRRARRQAQLPGVGSTPAVPSKCHGDR